MKSRRICILKTMKYAAFILAVLIQGIQCQNCTRTNTKNDVCTKSCDPIQDNCNRNRACVCDGDCGYSCVKRDLSCPKPKIDHGRVRYKTTLNSTARYRCTSPYKLEGPKKRTCRGNGDWDGITPVCKVKCTDPGNIPHGRKFHTSFELGKKVKYSCSSGFTMEGSSTLTCTRTGRWDRVKPNCACKRTNKKAFRYCENSCDPRASKCRGNRECVCDGDCGYSCVPEGLNCGRPTEIQNGERQYTSTRFGSTVRYRCNKPYSLLGAETRTCRGIREWDGVEPECKILCQDPEDIEYASKQVFQRNYDEDYVTVGDRVVYNCYPGYNTEGSKVMTCNDRGKWDKPKPKCIVPTCGPLQIPQNAQLWRSQKVKPSYKYGERVSFTCKSGYFARGLTTRRCTDNGWSNTSFFCSPKSCGDPESPSNGKVLSYIYTFGKKVYFECNHGYKLVGDKYRQCQSNQQWSGQSPTCEPIDCGVLPTPDKARKVWETHTRIDGVVRFECEEKGYEISGSETRTCSNDGLWSGNTTSCKIKSCGDPGSPRNGKQINVKNNYNYEGTVEFACNDNYTIAGSRKIICEETKDWSSPVPKCWAPCPDPGVPDNGSRIGVDFLHYRSVSFICHVGFELKGDKTITCMDGAWDRFRPQCKVVWCGDPGTPLNGRQAKVSNDYSYGGFVRFKCDKHYTLQGKSKLTCQADKRWDGEIPKCLASCPDPRVPDNGIRIGDDFLHGKTVSFNCSDGFELKGDKTIICRDGTWSKDTPQCKECMEGNPLGMSSGDIHDKSIRASSQTDQHPAHHGRLGRDSYWCSESEKESYIEINLPKKYKITKATIEVQDISNAGLIILFAQILQEWVYFHYETDPVSPGKNEIVPLKPFIAKKIRIQVKPRRRRLPMSVCLRAEVYGCMDVPRGCIMPGSAVFVKLGNEYWKGYTTTTYSTSQEVLFFYENASGSRASVTVSREQAVLDEKPDFSKLTKETLVLGKDLSSGLFKEGKIERMRDKVCTIKTDDNVWSSDLNDVRVAKIPEFCPT